jgi:hypothetical protein
MNSRLRLRPSKQTLAQRSGSAIKPISLPLDASFSKSDCYGGVTVSGKLAGLCNYPNDSLHATVSV